MARAIFLDRDGTINEDVGDLYQAGKLKFIPRAIEALKILQEYFSLFIVTNQSGINRKVFNQNDFLRFNRYFLSLLHAEGITINKVYYCPHTEEEKCLCHKPSPYFLQAASRDYGVDLKNSFILGDHPHDINMAHKAGCHSVYLLTGHGQKHRKELSAKPDFIAPDIYTGSFWVIQHRKPKPHPVIPSRQKQSPIP